MIKNTYKICSYRKIQSDFVLCKIFSFIPEFLVLKINKYCKTTQKKLNITKNLYEECLKSIIEIIPYEDHHYKFINLEENNSNYFHFYYNCIKDDNLFNLDNFDKSRNIDKIIITIDFEYGHLNLNNLFNECLLINKISFVQFKRNDFSSMKKLFLNCMHLQEVNFYDINTKQVTDMSSIFNFIIFYNGHVHFFNIFTIHEHFVHGYII